MCGWGFLDLEMGKHVGAEGRKVVGLPVGTSGQTELLVFCEGMPLGCVRIFGGEGGRG